MKIKTSRFGRIDVDANEVIEFAEGLLGFEKVRRFVILNTDETSPFRWLQCVDDGNLAFVIIEPLNFIFEYDLEISDADAGKLALQRAEDAVLFALVTIPENPQDMTANLQGPLVINAANRQGRQVISNNPAHFVRTRIIDEMTKRAKRLQAAQPVAKPSQSSPTDDSLPKEDRD